MQEETHGEFGGLGMEVTMEDGLVKVVTPIDDTPAAKAGIRAGDMITHIDDEAVQGLPLNQAVEKMRGPVNTKIKLKILRKGADKPLDIAINRETIRVRSVRGAGSAPNSVGGARRQAAVVQRAAQKAGWGATLPKDTGLGLATTFGQERDMPTWIACVARVRVDRGSGAVMVEKLTIVVDAGTVVDPDSALAQVEGGALWGLSLALHEGTEFVEGQVKDTNLDTYTPLRIGDVPELDIEFLDSTEVPVGLGEPGTTVVGPAIGNAIFAAVGARLRHLPIRPNAVLQALAQ
jgi:CO/xanthine dehydrogenase Mo-binding subunit